MRISLRSRRCARQSPEIICVYLCHLWPLFFLKPARAGRLEPKLLRSLRDKQVWDRNATTFDHFAKGK